MEGEYTADIGICYDGRREQEINKWYRFWATCHKRGSKCQKANGLSYSIITVIDLWSTKLLCCCTWSFGSQIKRSSHKKAKEKKAQPQRNVTDRVVIANTATTKPWLMLAENEISLRFVVANQLQNKVPKTVAVLVLLPTRNPQRYYPRDQMCCYRKVGNPVIGKLRIYTWIWILQKACLICLI